MTGSDPRPAKRARLSHDTPLVHGDVLDVEAGIGDKKRIFRIHKDVLEKSPFFKNAVKPEWSTLRGDRPIDVTDEDPNAIDIYFSWLYCPTLREYEEWTCLDYVLLYLLGQKFMDHDFQNAVIDGMIDLIVQRGDYPSNACVWMIYDDTIENSPVRQLLVDLWCLVACSENVAKYKRELPSDFMWDCMKAYASNNRFSKGYLESWGKDTTKYHVGRAEEDDEENNEKNDGQREQE